MPVFAAITERSRIAPGTCCGQSKRTYLAALHNYDNPNLGPEATWETRREAAQLRYFHSLQAVIDYAETLTEKDLGRSGTRAGRPITIYDSVAQPLVHGQHYWDNLRADYIPAALKLEALRPLLSKNGHPSEDAAQRRSAAAEKLGLVADRLDELLEPITSEQAFVGEPTVADALMRCSYRHKLIEPEKKMMWEDNPEVGYLSSRTELWNFLRPALTGQLRNDAKALARMGNDELSRSGVLGSGRFSVIMAFEREAERYVSASRDIEQKIRREGWITG